MEPNKVNQWLFDEIDRMTEHEKRQIKNRDVAIIRQISSIIRDIEELGPKYIPNELGELQGQGSLFDTAIARYSVWMELKRECK